MFSLAPVVCKALVWFSVKCHYCGKMLSVQHTVSGLRPFDYPKRWTMEEQPSTEHRYLSWYCATFFNVFGNALESKWPADLIKGTMLWCKQTQCTCLRPTKNIVCSCASESSKSGKHPEGRITQARKFWMLCMANGQCSRCSKTPSKFCAVSP